MITDQPGQPLASLESAALCQWFFCNPTIVRIVNQICILSLSFTLDEHVMTTDLAKNNTDNCLHHCYLTCLSWEFSHMRECFLRVFSSSQLTVSQS